MKLLPGISKRQQWTSSTVNFKICPRRQAYCSWARPILPPVYRISTYAWCPHDLRLALSLIKRLRAGGLLVAAPVCNLAYKLISSGLHYPTTVFFDRCGPS